MKRTLLAFLPIFLVACSAETTKVASPTVTPSTNSTEVATTSVVAATSTTEPTVSKLSTDQRLSSAQILDEPERCQIADITPQQGGSSGFPRPVEYERRKDLRVLVVPISVRDYLFSEEDLKIAETGIMKSAEFWNSMSYGKFNLESTILRVQESTVVVTCGESQGTGWAIDLGPVVILQNLTSFLSLCQQ